MKFEELTTQHQEFLMHCIFDHIKRKLKGDQVIEPTYEEYKAFFDEFDEAFKEYLETEDVYLPKPISFASKISMTITT